MCDSLSRLLTSVTWRIWNYLKQFVLPVSFKQWLTCVTKFIYRSKPTSCKAYQSLHVTFSLLNTAWNIHKCIYSAAKVSAHRALIITNYTSHMMCDGIAMQVYLCVRGRTLTNWVNTTTLRFFFSRNLRLNLINAFKRGGPADKWTGRQADRYVRGSIYNTLHSTPQ